MRKLIFSLGIAALGFTAFTAFTATTNTTPAMNENESTILWTGSKVVGGKHTGAIQVKESNLEFKKGKLTGGTVVADMTTITNTDQEGEWMDKLVGHLNSDDFFSTAKFPTSTIKITKITAAKTANTYNVVADLTIKGITNSEAFEVTVKDAEKGYLITSNVTIDRSKYDVKYGSSSFFDNLGDKAISNDFTLNASIFSAK